MAKVTFENLTQDQAIVFAEWYSGQGESNADIWFDVNCKDDCPMVMKIIRDDPNHIIVKCE